MKLLIVLVANGLFWAHFLRISRKHPDQWEGISVPDFFLTLGIAVVTLVGTLVLLLTNGGVW